MSNYSTSDTENGANVLTGVLIALFVFLALAFLADTAPDMGIKALAASNAQSVAVAAITHSHHKVS
jgi:hypothetical protein